jgi:hypothetical protein
MDDRDWLAQRFDERPQLLAVAYRMLGSVVGRSPAAARPLASSGAGGGSKVSVVMLRMLL